MNRIISQQLSQGCRVAQIIDRANLKLLLPRGERPDHETTDSPEPVDSYSNCHLLLLQVDQNKDKGKLGLRCPEGQTARSVTPKRPRTIPQ